MGSEKPWTVSCERFASFIRWGRCVFRACAGNSGHEGGRNTPRMGWPGHQAHLGNLETLVIHLKHDLRGGWKPENFTWNSHGHEENTQNSTQAQTWAQDWTQEQWDINAMCCPLSKRDGNIITLIHLQYALYLGQGGGGRSGTYSRNIGQSTMHSQIHT